MIRTCYQSPAQIMDVVHEILSESTGETQQLVIDFFDICYNPHDVLAVYDFLQYHKAETNLDIVIRLQGLSNVFNICIAGVADPDKRLMSSLGCTYFHNVQSFGIGSAKDLIIAANANIALEDKIIAFITNDYSVDKETLKKLMDDNSFMENKEMLSWGFKEWTMLESIKSKPVIIEEPSSDADSPTPEEY